MKTIEVNRKSIQRMAKLAAGLYLLITVLAIFTHFYVPGELIVAGDASKTASNIAANQGLFRGGIFSELIILLSEVVLSLILYVIFKPVSKTLSLIAAVSRLAMTTIHGFNVLNKIFVLVLLSGAGYLSAFDTNELNAFSRRVYLRIWSWNCISWTACHPAWLFNLYLWLLPKIPWCFVYSRVFRLFHR
jgi:hypothetical protein